MRSSAGERAILAMRGIAQHTAAAAQSVYLSRPHSFAFDKCRCGLILLTLSTERHKYVDYTHTPIKHTVTVFTRTAPRRKDRDKQQAYNSKSMHGKRATCDSKGVRRYCNRLRLRIKASRQRI